LEVVLKLLGDSDTLKEFNMRRFSCSRVVILPLLTIVSIAVGRADVALNIIATFDSSITGDANAAAIESTINNAINFYETTFTTHTAAPIGVTIKFSEMTSGLGQSNKTLYDVGYQSFINALVAANSGDSTDTTALAHLPTGANNPVTGATDFLVSTAELKALGFNAASFPPIGGFDGQIGLNTHITTPGSPGTSGQFSLLATAEHEIDEVLGLGSSLPNFTAPSPEDLFRYNSIGGRSFTTTSTATAFFSLDGTTDLAQFDNQNDGGDFGDWQSNPLPNGVQPKVQDAFATPGANLSLTRTSVESVALDALGYNLVNPVPEPTSLLLFGSLLAVTGVVAKRRARG
jgi:hypothetical protein